MKKFKVVFYDTILLMVKTHILSAENLEHAKAKAAEMFRLHKNELIVEEL